MQVAANIIAHWLNSDMSDHAGPAMACPHCGETAEYRGRREKTILTAVGEMTLTRAYYHCQYCGLGLFPRDEALGISDGALSPFLVRSIGTVASMVSFQESTQLLEELAGLTIDPKQVERTAERLGEEIAGWERKDVCEEAPSATTLYLGLDGTGIPMRAEELKGRQGKQPDGSALTREVKLVTVWSAELTDQEGIPVRDKGSVSYSAAIESAAERDTDTTPSEFALRVQREALRRGFGKASRAVVIGDGAKWIWNLAGTYFPDAIQIVDLYHAKGSVSEAAKAIHGPTSDIGKVWAKARRDELEAGKIDAVIHELDLHAAICKEAKNCRDYLEHNRSRMDYPTFRSQGLCTSSGVVEAGCKTAIGTRLKRAGMHWTVRGADSIIALRCCRLSGRFEDFWEWRATKLAS